MGDSMSSIVVSGDTSGAITIAAPAVSGTNTLTLPANTGTILTTASSGQSIPKAALPAGSILLVVSVAKTDTCSTTGAATWNDITGLSATITPTSSTSKFLIVGSLNIGANSGAASLSFRYLRNSTIIGVGDSAGSRPQATGTFYAGDTAGAAAIGTSSLSFLDSPATASAITYKIQGTSSTASIVYVNRSVRDNDGTGYDARFISTLVIMEIAA